MRNGVALQASLFLIAAWLMLSCPVAGADVVRPHYVDVDARKSTVLSGTRFVSSERRSKSTNIIRTDALTGERQTIFRVSSGWRLVSFSAGGGKVLLVQARVSSPPGASPRVLTSTATLMDDDGTDRKVVSRTSTYAHSGEFCGMGIEWGSVHPDGSILIGKARYSRMNRSKRRPCIGEDGRAHASSYGYQLMRVDPVTGKRIHHNLRSDPPAPGEWGNSYSPNGRLLALGTKRRWRILNLVTGEVSVRRLPKRFAAVSALSISDQGAIGFALYEHKRTRRDTTVRTSQVIYPNILESAQYREFAHDDEQQETGRFCGGQYVRFDSAWPLRLVGYAVSDPSSTFLYTLPSPPDSYQIRFDCDDRNLLVDVRVIGGSPNRYLVPLAATVP